MVSAMILNVLGCRYSQSNLDAFLDGRLSPRARRRVARHLDQCGACYQTYTRRKDLRRELQQSLPLVGRSGQPDFDRMWAAIRSELPRPEPPRTQFRYGLVVLMLLLALLVPFTMGNHELMRVVPSQPAPRTEALTETPDVTEPVAMATVQAASTEASILAAGNTPPTLPEPDLSR